MYVSQRRSTTYSPLTKALFWLAVAVIVFGENPGQPILRGWRVAHEALQLKAERDQLRRDNALLDQYYAMTRTPEGLELLARGRYHMVRKGEWLVQVIEPPPPPRQAPRGLRAVMDKMRTRADEGLRAWRSLRELLRTQRRSRPAT